MRSRGGKQATERRDVLAELEAVRQDAQGKGFDSRDRFRSGRPVGQDAGQDGKLGNPAAVVFRLPAAEVLQTDPLGSVGQVEAHAHLFERLVAVDHGRIITLGRGAWNPAAARPAAARQAPSLTRFRVRE